MTPVFTSGKLKKLFLLMVESAGAMREHLRGQFKGDSKTTSFVIRDALDRYTTDVIASVAFGIRTNCFETKTPEFYKQCELLRIKDIIVQVKYDHYNFFREANHLLY